MLQRSARRGFTLIELLLVIGIIAILASIVIVAINPTKQLGQARDAQRRSGVNTILNAVYQYAVDNNGNLPGNLSGTALTAGTAYHICRLNAGCTVNGAATAYNTVAVIDILTGSYLTAIPQDPRIANTGSASIAGYMISKDSSGRITVTAPYKEHATSISATR